jgi:hypothetical protein
VHLASDIDRLGAAQDVAAKKLLDYDGEEYPQDGCAITLSVLMQDAGISVPNTYRAIVLGNLLKSGEIGRLFLSASNKKAMLALLAGKNRIMVPTTFIRF